MGKGALPEFSKGDHDGRGHGRLSVAGSMKRHTYCLRVALYAAKAKKPFKIYSSIFEAAEKQGLSEAGLRKILQAGKRTADGVLWRYLKPSEVIDV